MLKFYDESHQYELDGVIIPSVSEILRFISREVYGDIDKYILDNAAERGTTVHLATQQIDQFGECEIDFAYQGYVQAYAKFLREHKCEWMYTEAPFADRERRYAGTPDRIGTVDGAFAIVDLKTNAAIKKALVKAQLNGYNGLAKANDLLLVERLLCLQLCNNGKYRLYDVAIDSTEFDACLAIHNSINKKHGRMKIE